MGKAEPISTYLLNIFLMIDCKRHLKGCLFAIKYKNIFIKLLTYGKPYNIIYL